MDNTKIQWTDATWNPLRGCSRVSAGCMNCYAEKVAARFAGTDSRTGLQLPYAGLIDRHGRWNGHVSLVTDSLLDPLRWKKPRKIFVNSMSDLFHENVPDEWIDRIFAVMALSPQHTFQCLTKRPKRMLRYFSEQTNTNYPGPAAHSRTLRQVIKLRPEKIAGYFPWPPPNVWLGVSVENQETAGVRIPILLDTPAAVRFVSYEPALGPVNFGKSSLLSLYGLEKKLDWIIVGGESGPGARRFDPAWARSVVQQCKAASVPVFVKQMGSDARTSHETLGHGEDPYWTKFLNRKGDDPEQWPEDLRVREFPR